MSHINTKQRTFSFIGLVASIDLLFALLSTGFTERRMMMYKCPFMIFLLVLLARESAPSCPATCTCDEKIFLCKKAKLKFFPDDLQTSIVSIDVSYNPKLRFPSNYFTKFKHLETLKLSHCSVNRPVYLPESIRSVDLSHNLLTIEWLELMFSKGNLTSVRNVLLQANKITISANNTAFSTFPKSISVLKLRGNHISKIKKTDLKRLRYLSHLDINNCGLSEIEAGAFNSLTELGTLDMGKNMLKELPAGLFNNTKKLSKLRLGRNRLTVPPDLRGVENLLKLDMQRNYLTSLAMKELGAMNVRELNFAGNKIKSFNLNGTNYFSLDLSRNQIKKLCDYAFGEQNQLTYIQLQNNNISDISPKAFRGIRFIGDLFLQRNDLKSVPEGLFQGMSIRHLYLFANKLNHTKGLLKGMKRAPELVLLFGNPDISSFEASDYQNMEKGSSIYIGCTNLKMIESGQNLMANVICSPSNDLSINTQIRALQGDGFRCRRKQGSTLYYICTPCPVGTAEQCNTENCNGVCVNCTAGSFYQDEMASIRCKWCPPGQYVPPDKVPGKRAIDCLTCPKNTNTNDTAGYRACPCLPEYARTERFGPCEKCNQTGIVCRKDYRELQKGYWMTWDTITNPSNQSCRKLYRAFMHNLDIKNDTYDRSSVNFTSCKMPLPHKCPIEGSCRGGVEAICETGYTGVLCAVCSKDYMKQFTKCRKCPSKAVAIIQCIAYIFSFFFVCFLISVTDKIELAGQKGDGPKRTFADIILSSLKILMGFYQVVSGLIHALSYINWPHSLKSVMGSFELIQLEILRIPSIHCIKADWRMNAVKEFWLALAATFAVPLLIFVYFLIKSLCLLCFSKETGEFKKKVNECSKNSFRAAILFLFATYPLTCTRIVQILPISCDKLCTVMDKGKCLREVSYMRCDYSLNCIKDSSSPLLRTAYAALIIPFGFPIALFLLLWRYAPGKSKMVKPLIINEHLCDSDVYHNAENIDRQHLLNDDPYSHNSHSNGEIPARRDISDNTSIVQFAVRFAYENYEGSCWYWEVVEMVRKLLLTVGLVLFLEHTKMGLAGIITIATVFTMAQAAMNPMKDSFENFLQLLSLTIIPINLSIGAIIHSKGIEDENIIDKKQDSMGLGIILILLNSLLIALVTCRFIRAIALKIISNIRSGRHNGCCARCLGFLCACVNLAPVNERMHTMDRTM